MVANWVSRYICIFTRVSQCVCYVISFSVSVLFVLCVKVKA